MESLFLIRALCEGRSHSAGECNDAGLLSKILLQPLKGRRLEELKRGLMAGMQAPIIPRRVSILKSNQYVSRSVIGPFDEDQDNGSPRPYCQRNCVP